MKNIKKLLDKVKKEYDGGGQPFDGLIELAIYTVDKLSSINQISYHSECKKNYMVFDKDGALSRPFLPNLFIDDTAKLRKNWKSLLSAIDPKNHCIKRSPLYVNKVLYTMAMSFAICIDLWKPKSRKTPGTYYEILLGSILSPLLPEHSRQKFISLPVDGEKVSTDIVFDKDKRGLVIPVKISTRERVVQPYAHQRILDSVFGPNRYKSILMCINETQRDDAKITTNDICVPGTIKLFQQHLSKLGGLYYLDPPERYLKKDLTSIIAVKTVGQLLTKELNALL